MEAAAIAHKSALGADPVPGGRHRRGTARVAHRWSGYGRHHRHVRPRRLPRPDHGLTAGRLPADLSNPRPRAAGHVWLSDGRRKLNPVECVNRSMMRNVVVLLCVLFATALTPVAAQTASCAFVLGFASLHTAIPDVVGDCVADQTYNPVNGDGLQSTTNGLLVWRNADNLMAFTNGYQS